MLVMYRKPGTSLKIGDNVEISVIKSARGGVQLGIKAPENIRIQRMEDAGTHTAEKTYISEQ